MPTPMREVMQGELIAAAGAMYRALRNAPCACCHRWADHGTKRERIYQCPRCRAVEQWEALVTPVRDVA
jgi:hypothetical protein